MQNILIKKCLRSYYKIQKSVYVVLRFVIRKKAFKINELLVEQLRNTEFRNTKFLILLSRQIERFLQFCLD